MLNDLKSVLQETRQQPGQSNWMKRPDWT
jgi:hypothetical protein